MLNHFLFASPLHNYTFSINILFFLIIYGNKLLHDEKKKSIMK